MGDSTIVLPPNGSGLRSRSMVDLYLSSAIQTSTTRRTRPWFGASGSICRAQPTGFENTIRHAILQSFIGRMCWCCRATLDIDCFDSSLNRRRRSACSRQQTSATGWAGKRFSLSAVSRLQAMRSCLLGRGSRYPVGKAGNFSRSTTMAAEPWG